MKLSKFYELVVKYGMSQDPRGKSGLDEYFKNAKKEYKKLKGIAKRVFDKEALNSPYSDTRILYGDPDTQVKKIMVGVDIEGPEILLAEKIREREGLDLVVSHHPEGTAYAGLSEVMYLQSSVLTKFGIAKEIVDEFLKERINEVARRVSGANHARPVDTARLLNMPFISCHTPADNHVAKYLQDFIDKKHPKKVKEVINIISGIQEFEDGLRRKAGPTLILGKPENKVGKVFVDMTGGTEGPKQLFGRLSQAGVGTLVCMHLSEEHFAKAKPEHINVIIAGHIASDNLGLNLILDRIETQEKLDIVACSGFKRISRL